MARRYEGHMWGQQYLGNTAKNQVHDLDNEKTGPNECQIGEIIKAGHDTPFTSLADAHKAGYDDCDYCL